MNRDRFEELLAMEREGELGADLLRELDDACANDATLRLERERDSKLGDLLSFEAPDRAPAGLTSNVMAAIRFASAEMPATADKPATVDKSAEAESSAPTPPRESAREGSGFGAWISRFFSSPIPQIGFAVAALLLVALPINFYLRQDEADPGRKLAEAQVADEAVADESAAASGELGATRMNDTAVAAVPGGDESPESSEAGSSGFRPSLDRVVAAAQDPPREASENEIESESESPGDSTDLGFAETGARSAGFAPEIAGIERTTESPDPNAPKPGEAERRSDMKTQFDLGRAVASASADMDADTGGKISFSIDLARVTRREPIPAALITNSDTTESPALSFGGAAKPKRGGERTGARSPLRRIETALAAHAEIVRLPADPKRPGVARLRASIKPSEFTAFLEDLRKLGVLPREKAKDGPNGAKGPLAGGFYFFEAGKGVVGSDTAATSGSGEQPRPEKPVVIEFSIFTGP